MRLSSLPARHQTCTEGQRSHRRASKRGNGQKRDACYRQVAHRGQPNTAHGGRPLAYCKEDPSGQNVAPSAFPPSAGNRQWLQIARIFERRLGFGRQAAESSRDWLHRYSLEGNISNSTLTHDLSNQRSRPDRSCSRIASRSGEPARPGRRCAVVMKMAAVAIAPAISGRPAAGRTKRWVIPMRASLSS